MALRDLIYDIRFAVDTRQIREATNREEDLEDQIRQINDRMDGFNRRIRQSSDGVLKLGDLFKFGLFTKGIGLLGDAFRAGTEEVGKWIETANGAQEIATKFDIVFGNNADVAKFWVTQVSSDLGRGQLELTKGLADLQNTLFGFTDGSESARKVSGEFSKQVLQLALDLGSFQDIGTEESLNLMLSGLIGNHEAFIRLGASVTEQILKQKTLQLGFKQNFNELDAFSKMMVRFSVVVDQNQTAIGDNERSSDTYAAKVRKLQGRIQDLRQEWGEKLLPVAGDFVEFLFQNSDMVGELGASISEFLKTSGRGLIDWLKDEENIKQFKENINSAITTIDNLTTGIDNFLKSDGLNNILEAFGFVGKAIDTGGKYLGAIMGRDMTTEQEVDPTTGDLVIRRREIESVPDEFKLNLPGWLDSFFDKLGGEEDLPGYNEIFDQNGRRLMYEEREKRERELTRVKPKLPDYYDVFDDRGNMRGDSKETSLNVNVTIQGNGDEYLAEKFNGVIEDNINKISNMAFKDIRARVGRSEPVG